MQIDSTQEHYDAQLAQEQQRAMTEKVLAAFDVALCALNTIAMQDVDPSWQRAMDALREINGIMCGDGSRMYRVPSVRTGEEIKQHASAVDAVREFDEGIRAEQAFDAEMRR
jgi:hypothetical protein